MIVKVEIEGVEGESVFEMEVGESELIFLNKIVDKCNEVAGPFAPTMSVEIIQQEEK